MLTLFVDNISPRIDYVFRIIFEDRAIKYRLVTSIEEFKAAAVPKMVYSQKVLEDSFPTIKATNLLQESTVKKQLISVETWCQSSVISFDGMPDVLASIFYVVSLYDDYIKEKKDQHGRNIGASSFLYQQNWLNQLIVERWIEALILFIEKENNYQIPKQKLPFSVMPTFDIDHAYAYKLRSSWRLFLILCKDVFLQKKDRIIERSEVLNQKKKDPFDTFNEIEAISNRFPNTKIFWLLGDYGKYDRNISFKNKEQKELIQRLNAISSVGLHPSYASNQSIGQLAKEKQRLETILNEQVKLSRQHFLKLEIPTTFERLERLGFSDDYSLGYADKIGFRAGVARPFLWFNLTKNSCSKLTLHPITYMDGTLKEYMNLSINEAVNRIRDLKKEVEQFGGVFTPLWHNETIGDFGNWKDWKAVLYASI